MPTSTVPSPRELLTEAEVACRMLLLADLQAALAALGVRSVLARNHRLVLQYNVSPYRPSGLTDPTLHIFCPDGTGIASTDGTTYRLDIGQEYPASDPAAAASVIQHAIPRG